MITIEPITTAAEGQLIEELAVAAWGPGTVPVPDHLLITIARNKGVVLLARDGDRPIGFCFSFVAFVGEPPDAVRLKHCSHMAAVLPAYQASGIGEQLKWAQRAAVLAQQIEHITWTYDPLETRNARLNLGKLGAVCATYKRNVYGTLRDALNAGLDTDRFEVDWWLRSPRVVARADGRMGAVRGVPDGAELVNSAELRADLLHPGPVATERIAGQPVILVQLPDHFQRIKQHDMGLARAWRAATRALFEHAFAAGYVATDVVWHAPRAFYVLERGWSG